MIWNSQNLNFRESGSIRFTEEQLTSYSLILDVEIVSYIRESYVNFKGNPPYGFWGVGTIFQGGIANRRMCMEYPRQRLLNMRNEAAGISFNDASSYYRDNIFQSSAANALDFQITNLFTFPANKVLRHPDTLVKFKALPKSQFKFTVWWINFPTSSEPLLEFGPEDPTTGFPEYPEPTQNPADDPYLGNPAPDDPNPLSDPRDYSDENLPDPFIGVMTFEFSNNNAAFSPAQPIDNILWPGQIVATPNPQFQASISWLDDDGNYTLLARTNFPPCKIRFVQIETPNNQLFIPDPNSFEDT